MTLLILGFSLWWATHIFPIALPLRRASVIARLGEGPYKGVFSLATLVSIIMMVIGYQQAEFIIIWNPPIWAIHLNNVLMLLAIFLVGAKHAKSSARWSMAIWLRSSCSAECWFGRW